MSLTAPCPTRDRATRITELVEALAVSRSAHDRDDTVEDIVTHAFTAETLDTGGHHVQLRLTGELDVAIAREVRNLLKGNICRGKNITVDLSGLTFLDTAGLESLMEPINLARDCGRTVMLTGSLQPQVERLLQLTHAAHLVGQACAPRGGPHCAIRRGHVTKPIKPG